MVNKSYIVKEKYYLFYGNKLEFIFNYNGPSRFFPLDASTSYETPTRSFDIEDFLNIMKNMYKVRF